TPDQERIEEQKRIEHEKANEKRKQEEQKRIEEDSKKVEERVAQLIKDLKSKNPADRIKAAEALRDIGEDAKSAREALCDAILDPREAIVTAVAAALEKVDPGLQKPILTLRVD